MGESKLQLIALPEELGTAIQLASVLWLNYIQQLKWVSVSCVQWFTYLADIESRDRITG